MLGHLTRYDAVTFYSLLQNYQSASGNATSPSPWLFTAAADRLFKAAKARVYTIDACKRTPDGEKKMEMKLILETNPKWVTLAETITELNESDASHRILIMAKDEHTAVQLKEFLVLGSSNMMKTRFMRSMGQKVAAKVQKISVERSLLVETFRQVTDEMKETSLADKNEQAETE